MQLTVKKYKDIFKYYPTLSFRASCGSGKTLAGIYLIHYFGIKTLIISSRTSINDQWYNIIKSLYPNIEIQTKDNHTKNPLIYIYSPQYMIKHLDNFPVEVNFIIYDEIHSIVSDNYGKCIEEPINQYKNKLRDNIPYMLALSGTYPQKNKLLKKRKIKNENLFNTLYYIFNSLKRLRQRKKKIYLILKRKPKEMK